MASRIRACGLDSSRISAGCCTRSPGFLVGAVVLKSLLKIFVQTFLLLGICLSASLALAQEPAQFVVQLTRGADNHGHRRALLQIDKVLEDIGPGKLKI